MSMGHSITVKTEFKRGEKILQTKTQQSNQRHVA